MPDHERLIRAEESPEQVLQELQQQLTGIPNDALLGARDDFCNMKAAERDYFLGKTDRKPFTATENIIKDRASADKEGSYEKAVRTFERYYRRLRDANIYQGRLGKVNEDQLRGIGKQSGEPNVSPSTTSPQK